MRNLLAERVEFWQQPSLSAESSFRNRAKLAVSRVGGRGAPLTFGLAPLGGRPQDLSDCPLYLPAIRVALPAIKRALRATDLRPYDPATHSGQLRHVICTANGEGELMVRVVCRTTAGIVPIRNVAKDLRAELPSLVYLGVNLLPERVALVEGSTEVPIFGDHLEMPVAGMGLRLGPQSFFQTNTAVAGSLYQTAADWADFAARSLADTGNSVAQPRRAFDLYCGVGGFALQLALHGWAVTGVEVSEDACQAASLAARKLGVDANFVVADATQWARAQDFPQLVVVNPPRRGIGSGLAALLNERATHVLYSSCNPLSLARDLEMMPALRATRGRIFDMFPHTPHVETLLLLSRD